MNHREAPLYEALCTYEQNNKLSLHVPGHKDGSVFDAEAGTHFYNVLKIDATEINGLDDLHHPTGVIARAQALAADAFGAEHTFFLVNGSTAGNLAAALTLCSPGDTILVQRNAHKSIFNGLLLAGACPVYILPEIEPATRVAAGINPEWLRAAIDRHPEAKAVWITNPNYYGMGQDVVTLVEMCHQAGLPLVVDEAHGAHFGQTDGVPPSALQAGADLVIQSTHKMLTAMTMASMLHIQGPLIPRDKLARVLAMVQSSSPSYPLMASLDVARRYLVMRGREQLHETIRCLERYRTKLKKELKLLSIWDEESEPQNSPVYSRDPLKWVLTSSITSVTGYQLLEWLEEKGCVAEMADTQNVVLAFSINTEEAHIKKVATILKETDEKMQKLKKRTGEARTYSPQSTELFSRQAPFIIPVIPLQEAFHRDKEEVLLKDAVGRYSAEMVIPYPPGIPLLTPGEEITDEHIETIRRIQRAGGYFQGASDETMDKMFVLVSP